MSGGSSGSEFRRHTARFVENGLFMVCEHLGRENAREFLDANNRNRIIRVFDTGIIVAACAPWRMGPRTENNAGGYGAILPDFGGDSAVPTALDEENEAELARLLSDFALFRASQGAPKSDAPTAIFQLNDHYDETEAIFGYVRNDAERASGDVSALAARTREDALNARLAALIAHNAQEATDPDDTLRLVALLVRRLQANKVVGGRSQRVISQWDNFLSMNLKSGGIFRIEHVQQFAALADAYGHPFAPCALSVPEPGNELEQDVHNEIVRQWSARLKDFKTGEVLKSARAIADLFVLNFRMLQAAPKHGESRIEFVTGDRNLCWASYRDLQLPNELLARLVNQLTLAKVVDAEDRVDQFLKNFAFWHIRHLWGFVEEAVLNGKSSEGIVDDEKLFSHDADMEWLHGLLANWSGGTRFSRRQLIEILHALGSAKGDRIIRADFGRAISSLVADKEKKAEVLSAAQRLRQSITHNLDESTFRKLQSNKGLYTKIVGRFGNVNRRPTGYGWTEIVKDIERDVDRYDDETVVSLSNIGAKVLLSARKTGRRNPPTLLFDNFLAPRNIVNSLSRGTRKDEYDVFRNEYSSIEEQCLRSTGEEEPSKALSIYLKYLVLGCLFASANRWGVAYSHSERAIQAFLREKKALQNRLPVNGREAYFLASVTKRLIAQRFSDYNIAQDYLQRAETAFSDDMAQERSKSESVCEHELRFCAERMALALSRYYYMRWSENDNPHSELAHAAYASAKNGQNLYEKAINDFGASKSEGSESNVSSINLVTLAVNIVQARVIFEYRRWKNPGCLDECPVTNDQLEKLLLTIDRRTMSLSVDGDAAEISSNRIIKTPLIASYEVIGHLVLRRAGVAIVDKMPDLKDLQMASDSPGIACYDGWRHESLLDFGKYLYSHQMR